jgi:hypothetical protein
LKNHLMKAFSGYLWNYAAPGQAHEWSLIPRAMVSPHLRDASWQFPAVPNSQAFRFRGADRREPVNAPCANPADIPLLKELSIVERYGRRYVRQALTLAAVRNFLHDVLRKHFLRLYGHRRMEVWPEIFDNFNTNDTPAGVNDKIRFRAGDAKRNVAARERWF